MPRQRWSGAERERFAPIAARTDVLTEPLGDRSFDFVLLGFLRAGSLQMVGDFEPVTAVRGDVVALAPVTDAQARPGPDGATVTTLIVDRDLIVDSTLWEFSAQLRGRPDAEKFLARRFPDAFTHTRIGERVLRDVEPRLDELVELTARGKVHQRFKRAVALLFAVLDEVEPALAKPDPLLAGAPSGVEGDLSLPRRRIFQPLRPEVRRAAELLASDPTRPWTLADLAAEVGLSPNRLRSLFVHHLGKTPWAYHNMLRARRLAALLLDADLSVSEAIRAVGWSSHGHGAQMFRRYAGMSPRQYRDRHASPTAR